MIVYPKVAILLILIKLIYIDWFIYYSFSIDFQPFGAPQRYRTAVERYRTAAERYRTAVERYRTAVERYRTAVTRYRTAAERYRTAVERCIYSVFITACRFSTVSYFPDRFA